MCIGEERSAVSAVETNEVVFDYGYIDGTRVQIKPERSSVDPGHIEYNSIVVMESYMGWIAVGRGHWHPAPTRTEATVFALRYDKEHWKE